MKQITKILIIALCVVLSLNSCRRKQHEPEEIVREIPIDFAALSQHNAVKAGTMATTPLSDYHDDFGVWGIARSASNTAQPEYLLWDRNSLSKATKNTSGNYIPERTAFWLSGYSYNFIAVAPYVENMSVQHTAKTATTPDALTFTYSLASKYEASEYNFDLMGAAAMNEVQLSTTHPSTQTLIFWHLFTQLNINVSFVDDNGDSSVGEVQEMRLYNVHQSAEYTISCESENCEVDCTSDPSSKLDDPIVFNSSNDPWTLHIVPQDISDFELYIDFTLGEGASKVTFTDYKLDLSAATEKNYGYNEKYNWNITIGPKATISFDVTVAQWITIAPDAEGGIPSIDIK